MQRSLLLAFASLAFPIVTMASDFAVLQVGLGSMFISAVIIFFGFKAGACKLRDKLSGFIIFIVFLTMLGAAMVMSESEHMGDYDFWGLLGIVLTSGVLATIVPLILFNNRSK